VNENIRQYFDAIEVRYMPNAPHHVHKGKEVVGALLKIPELLSFLDEIEKMVV